MEQSSQKYNPPVLVGAKLYHSWYVDYSLWLKKSLNLCQKQKILTLLPVSIVEQYSKLKISIMQFKFSLYVFSIPNVLSGTRLW